jgi:hypothetical protein
MTALNVSNISKKNGIRLLLLVLFLAASISILSAAQFGYLISDDSLCSIWWAEGAYKIMKDDPLPAEKGERVILSCAMNEYEPFQLILLPKKRMEKVRIESSTLYSISGYKIVPENISISHVEYVSVVTPTDEYGAAGEWPDPLPPYERPFTAYPGENHPLWVTVHVPPDANPGIYDGMITLTSGTWKKEIQIRLNVWNFVLPEQTHIRSAFGLNTSFIKAFHNLETKEELEKVYDLYAQNLKEHRLCPTSPLDLYPMKVSVSGVYWEGGEFVSDVVHAGQRALKIRDDDVSANAQARYKEKIPVQAAVSYKLTWFARTEEENQEYTVMVSAYNAEGEFLPAQNKLQVYKGTNGWKQEAMEISGFSSEVKEVSLNFFPTFRDDIGSKKGTAYFDDAVFSPSTIEENLLHGGDFEMDLDSMSVEVNFSEFDRGAKRYLDEFGFNSFNLHLQGLGSGSFYSSQEGIFAGFRQGTAEYDKLLSDYLRQVEEHLKENDWLGKEYIYWFDEPDPKDYPFVRKGMENIRKAAPRLTRFITEHKPGPEIMDVTEISCTIFHRVDPKIVADLVKKGREFWSYLCTGPKGPWLTLFIDHPASNLRLWLWMSYKYQLKGILVWEANYWTSGTVFPPGMLQNPWQDPMSYTVGYGTPYGQVNHWGNGDGRFLYPPNRAPNKDKRKFLAGPINSIRWEILREGIEDYEYFWLLENKIKKAKGKKELVEKGRQLLNFPETVFKDGQSYTKDPKILLEYRARIAELLEKF